MAAQTGLITIEIKDVVEFRESCEESYVYITDIRSTNGVYDMHIEFQTIAQVFVCGQLFLKKIVEKERIALENE